MSIHWTSRADQGAAGVAGYDIRYSTASIDETNWDVAIAVTGEPTAAVPGTTERFSIGGLQPSTKYYIAVKSFDYAATPNVSAISNIVSGTTMPPVQPVVVHNPWLANDRVADTHNISTMGATYVKAYTPDGVIPPTSNEAKAINIYNNQKRRLYHWASEVPAMGGNSITDPAYNQNVFGWGLCGRHANMACTIVSAAGLTPHMMNISNPWGHWTYQVEYDGATHAFDTMCTVYVYDKSNPRKIASCAQLGADSTLLLNAAADGRACPGLLLCGDDINEYRQAMGNASDSGGGVVASVWNGNMDLRVGQSFKRTWESWPNQHPTSTKNADSAPGNDPPYHHEANKDWKDTTNFPYWEPYQLTSAQSTALNIPMSTTYRRWANGTDTIAPDFRSAAYQALLHSGTGIATYYADGITPDLHPAAVGTMAEAVFKIDFPFFITDATFSGDFVKAHTGDVCSVLVSKDGSSWATAWSASTIGTTTVTNQSLRANVFNTWATWYIKVQLKSTAAKSDAGVSNFTVTTIFEHNKGSMPYLDKGVNNITLTFDNSAQLQASGNVLHVVYKWKEYSGSDWTVDRQFETNAISSPTTFTITTSGTKVPRTEYILLEVVQPPLDLYPPAAITNLASGAAQATKVPLTWTAPGNDGNVGTALSYDVRYSTSVITDDATFAAATPATGVPSPKPAGSTETFTLTGLAGSTTYWVAVKTHDATNVSDVSNVIVVTTTPPDLVAPQTVTNLVAATSKTTGGIDLTWTAPADYGVNGAGPYTCTSYNVRYSTSAITDDSTFAAATVVTDLAAPQAPGARETLTVPGLTGGTRYYFAIKTTDDAGNISAVSNSALAKASIIGERVLQVGANGYTGCNDSYVNVGSPTANNNGLERMAVTGYGSTNYQRGYVRFDLSGLPAGAPIVSAKLYLYAYDQAGSRGSSGFYGLYPVTRSWTDSQVTWNNATTGTAWTTPGGDFGASEDATSPKQAPASVPCWYSFDVTARVQAWLAGSSTNYGWVLKCTDESRSNQDRFYQSDTASAAFRPMLVISDVITEDSTAPAAVANLTATDSGDGSIHLTWTASGDDGTTGTAFAYDLRYHTQAQGAITEANWHAATVIGIPTPAAAGTSEGFDVAGLSSRQGYYFALKVRDEANNTSAISNVPYVYLAPGPRSIVIEPSMDGPMYGLSSGSGNSNRGAGGRFDLNGADSTKVDSALIKFDLTDVLLSHERIASATLDLFAAKTVANASYNMDVRAYPLLVSWVEGTGTNGEPGSTAWPWGPAVIGDTVYNYWQVTATGTDSSFGGYVVATAGVPWTVPGARGVGTDVSNDLMVSQNISGAGFTEGQNLCSLTFSPTGVQVVNQWARNTRTNYGFSLFPLNGGTGSVPVTTREYATAACHPKLRLSIVPTIDSDINCDGHVDVLDLLSLADSWATASGDPDFDPDCDLNADGRINVLDLLTLAQSWGM